MFSVCIESVMSYAVGSDFGCHSGRRGLHHRFLLCCYFCGESGRFNAVPLCTKDAEKFGFQISFKMTKIQRFFTWW